MAKRKRKEQVDHMTDEEYQNHRRMLRLLVRTRETFMDVKTATGNRIGIKADGQRQNVEVRETSDEDQEMLDAVILGCEGQAKLIENNLKKVLRRFRFYNEWLEGVLGVGPNHAAWIIGEIDIRHADTVSKITQFAGMNPSMVLGQISVEKAKYRPEMGEIISTLPPRSDGIERIRVLTNTLIRGDKMTKGFLSPYNKNLRVALLGRLATSFIRSTTPTYYATTFYRPYKARLENRDATVGHRVKGKTEDRAWKDVSPGHRDAAARRFMVKQFLKDVYVNWRTIEGLPVREPYAEEYLGKKHKQSTQLGIERAIAVE